MSLSKKDFDNYAAQGFNRIPLMREVLADLDTPLSVYLKLACGPYSYLFESVQGGEEGGRYSIIGPPARPPLSAPRPPPGGPAVYSSHKPTRWGAPRRGKMAKPDAIGAPDILLTVSDEV